LADKGYVGEKIFITPLKKFKDHEPTEEEKIFNSMVNRPRVVVENSFGMVKDFRSMSTPWRHARDRHAAIFGIVCELVNMKKNM